MTEANDDNSKESVQGESGPLKITGLLVRLAIPILIVAVGWYGYSKLSVEPEKEKKAKQAAKQFQATEVWWSP